MVTDVFLCIEKYSCVITEYLERKMQTYIVYFSALFLILLLTHKAQSRNKKAYVIFAALILACIAGFRAPSVGIDTQNYMQLFGRIADGRFEIAYGLETSFKYICAFLLAIWRNYNFLFFVFALITNVLIFDRLWDLKDRISIPWAATVYFGVFYFMTFNIMRQFVAAAIVFWATRYLVKKKYYKFLIFVAIACLFHNSALLGVLFIALELFAWKYLTKKQKWIVTLFWVIGIIVGLLFGALIIGRYANYFKTAQVDFGIVVFIKMALLIFTSILISKEKFEDVDENGYSVTAYTSSTVRIYYAVGLLLTMLGYVFAYMDRVGIYFYLFEAVYIGMLMRSKRVDSIVKIAVAALYLLLTLMSLLGDGQGQATYLFFWQA